MSIEDKSDHSSVGHLHIFGDESGCTGSKFDDGNSSTHYTIALIRVQAVDVLKQSVESYQRGLGPQARRELHFHSMNKEERLHFLRFIRDLRDVQLDVYVLVVNKKQMPRKVRPKSSEMYESFVAMAFDVFRDDITDAIVKMDKVTYGGKHVLSRIQKTVNGAAMHPVIHDMQFEASHSSYGIQVADAFCGAVHKKYEKNESEYFGTIQKLIHIVEK